MQKASKFYGVIGWWFWWAMNEEGVKGRWRDRGIIQCQGSGEGHACTLRRTCPWWKGNEGGNTGGRWNSRQGDKPNRSIRICLSLPILLRLRHHLLRHLTPPFWSSWVEIELRWQWMKKKHSELFALFFPPKHKALVRCSLIYVPFLRAMYELGPIFPHHIDLYAMLGISFHQCSNLLSLFFTLIIHFSGQKSDGQW